MVDRPVKEVLEGWVKVDFPASDWDVGEYGKLCRAFEALWTAAGKPADAALFGACHYDSSTTLYFPPGAVRVAGKLLDDYVVVPCEAPSLVGPVVGGPEARKLLPESITELLRYRHSSDS